MLLRDFRFTKDSPSVAAEEVLASAHFPGLDLRDSGSAVIEENISCAPRLTITSWGRPMRATLHSGARQRRCSAWEATKRSRLGYSGIACVPGAGGRVAGRRA